MSADQLGLRQMHTGQHSWGAHMAVRNLSNNVSRKVTHQIAHGRECAASATQCGCVLHLKLPVSTVAPALVPAGLY